MLDTTLSDASELARYLMNLHELDVWTFVWDNAKRRAGQCRYRFKTISLSVHFVRRNSIEEVAETILHEIAHAIAGWEAGHGEAWKRVCRRIGCRPVACYDSNTVKMPKGNWVAACKGCGKEFHSIRKPKYVNHPTVFYSCKRCGQDKGRLTYHCIKQ